MLCSGGESSVAVSLGGIPALFIIVRKTRSNTVGTGSSVVCGGLQLIGSSFFRFRALKNSSTSALNSFFLPQ